MGWQEEQKILQDVKAIVTSQKKVEELVSDNSTAITALHEDITALKQDQANCCNKLNEKLDKQETELETLKAELDDVKEDLAKLVAFLIPPPPKPAAGFTAYIS